MSAKDTAVLGVGVLGSMRLGSALSLITDRTLADVRRWAELNAKAFADMTADEQAEWLSGMKGAYNASDLNRVGEAVLYVAGRLNAAGNTVFVSPRTDWTREDIPTPAQMAHYLEQVRTIRGVLAVGETTPAVPADMDGLTWAEANDIEKILVDIDRLITNTIAAYCYSGDLYGGEV